MKNKTERQKERRHAWNRLLRATVKAALLAGKERDQLKKTEEQRNSNPPEDTEEKVATMNKSKTEETKLQNKFEKERDVCLKGYSFSSLQVEPKREKSAFQVNISNKITT